jgi:hypothetical protein
MLFQRRRRYRWAESKRTPKFRWLPALLIAIGVLLGLELLATGIVRWASLGEKLAFNQPPAIVQAYQLRFANHQGQPFSSLNGLGELKAEPSPLTGYRLLPSQQTPFWSINEQGFRDQDPLPSQKPANEIRIFVLGGSTAFGQLSSSNAATLVEQLETRLNTQVSEQQANADKFQPAILPFRADHVEQALALPPRIRDGKYRVINAAVPGYASGNELAQLVQQVANYQPDSLIVLDSYADLILPSDHMAVGIPGLEAALQNQRPSLLKRTQNNIGQWFLNRCAVSLVRYYGLGVRAEKNTSAQSLNLISANTSPDSAAALKAILATDKTELNKRAQRYRQHLLQMVHWAAGTQKPLIIALQPEISGRSEKSLAPEEKAILENLGKDYSAPVKAGYTQLASAANEAAKAFDKVKVLNFYQSFESFQGQAFQNATTLTDAGNEYLADQLYGAIATHFALSAQPFGT